MRSIDKEMKRGRDDKEAPSRPRIRRRHGTSNAIEVFSEEGTQSAGQLEAPGLTLGVREGSDSSDVSFSLRGVLELLKAGLVGKPRFKSV